MKGPAFARLVILGTVILAIAGCDGNGGGSVASFLAGPGSATAAADTLGTCAVAREAQQTFTDISAGSAAAVSELEHLITDAESLASRAETAHEENVYLDATGLSQDADTLTDNDSVTSTAQLQGELGLIMLTTDAASLMLDGNC